MMVLSTPSPVFLRKFGLRIPVSGTFFCVVFNAWVRILVDHAILGALDSAPLQRTNAPTSRTPQVVS